MNIGTRIIDGIISAGLCHSQCADNQEHGCVVVWSSGAAEQIEAIVGHVALENDRLIAALKFISQCEELKEARNTALQAGICAGGKGPVT